MADAQQKRLNTRIKKLVAEYPNEVLRALLDGSFWPEGLNLLEAYIRISDDNNALISVAFSHDSDARPDAIPIVEMADDPEEPEGGLRFRTYFGGGDLLRVRNALLCLAVAILMDNETRPQNNRVRM